MRIGLRLTDNVGRDLGDFTDIFVGLHDPFDTSGGEFGLDLDALGDTRGLLPGLGFDHAAIGVHEVTWLHGLSLERGGRRVEGRPLLAVLTFELDVGCGHGCGLEDDAVPGWDVAGGRRIISAGSVRGRGVG